MMCNLESILREGMCLMLETADLSHSGFHFFTDFKAAIFLTSRAMQQKT